MMKNTKALVKGARALLHIGHVEAAQALLEIVEGQTQGPVTYFLDRPTEDYLAPDLKLINAGCLEPYQTVIGWLALGYPTELRRMLDEDSYLHETQRLGFKATSRANHQTQKVRAPAFLKERGIDYVNAYPLSLLRQIFREEFGR